MRNEDIIRAWKDEDYRISLSDEERAMLPEHPAGVVDLSDEDLDDAAGGTTIICGITITGGITALLSCSPGLDTVFRGSCGFFSAGCCGTKPPGV